MQPLVAADVQGQQPGQRQEDLLDLGEVDAVAQALEVAQVLLGERQRGAGPQPAPGPAVELDERRADEAGRVVGAVPLAAATRVWRDLFPAAEQVYVEGLRLIREKWKA